MKKIIKNIVILVLFAVGFTGCDDYLDVNTPSDAQNVEDLDMKDIMGPVMLNTIYANYYAELSFGNYTQYFGSYGNGAIGITSTSSTWSNIYTKILPNIDVIKDKANEQGAKHYEAVAKILEAINMSFAVESWGDVPYAQATQPFEYPNPALEDGQQVYSKSLTLLNEAISALESADPSLVGMGKEDLVYNGDYDKWLRAAYTFKARMQLKMIKNGGASANDVLSSISNGFTSNSDNFELFFPEGKISPYFSTNILSRSTSNFFRAPNDQLITMMNGKTYPFESGVVEIDPRLPAIFENEGDTGDPWRGFMNGGTGESSDIEDDSDPDNIIYFSANTFYKNGGYHTSESAPLIMITYAEAMFIKAEAAFLANGGNTTSVGSTVDAYTAYMAGISANMGKVGVNGSAYMADTSVDVGEAGLMLNHIMKEKYIANIHSTETYSDMRRYNFSSDVFKGLSLRLEEDSESEYLGQWYRRSIYPLSEADTNSNIEQVESSSVINVWLFE
ncbi:MAG: SusD/RagB family nutrient-binding outer membrane lipoprotein [Flavobacteriaceae bacterium]|nr:SusD/RagB family nutrient-binding outer membrane lipoprotein [Flavobacteriaceae bacterium]